MTNNYPRDLIGYGEESPAITWPNKARIAVQFVLNYEEGAENCVLHGDRHSETFLSEIIGAKAYDMRHMSMESMYEYGSRSGFWRLYRLFKEFQMPVTVYGVAMAMQKNPAAVEAMLTADWEIASHSYRWIDYQLMSKEQEREHIAKAISIHTELTGSAPKGWYTGRDSPQTRDLILEHDCFLYDSDSYADDLPYWLDRPNVAGLNKDHLIIPYTLDTNDMRFATPQGFHTSEQFYIYLRDAFDCLYNEGETHPKMLNIGLHCRIIGRPARIIGLQKFMEYIASKSNVWICKRVDIAEHWYAHYPRSKLIKMG